MKFLIFSAFFVVAMLSNSAVAQPRTGSRLGDRLEQGDAMKIEDAVANSRTLARCIVSSRDRTAIRFLTTLDAEDYENASNLLFRDVACDFFRGAGALTESIQSRNSPASMRGLIAEAILEKRGNLDVGEPSLPVLAMQEGYDRDWFSMTQRPATVDAMAACFADTQPSLIYTLLRTEANSKAEGTAIGNVAAELGPCLIAGAELQANVFTLRAALAEAYFHRIYSPLEKADEPSTIETED